MFGCCMSGPAAYRSVFRPGLFAGRAIVATTHWSLPNHDRPAPFDGFHLATPPRVPGED